MSSIGPTQRSPSQANQLSPRLQVALLGLACLALFGWQMWRYGIIQDDAYISLVYARNLASGLGLEFNPGERVEGYTNFLWTVLLALPHWFGVDAALTAQVLGAACGIGVIGVGWGLGRQLAPARPLWTTFLVPLLLAANGALAFWSLSGLETSLFVLFVTAAAWRYLCRGGLDPGSGLLLALATLTRPEGAMFAILTGLHQLVVRDRSLRRLWADRDTRAGLVLAFALVLPHLLFRLLYYGDFVPNTFHAKTGISLTHLDHGLRYVGKFLADYGFGGLVWIAALWLCWQRQGRTHGCYIAAVVTTCLVYAVAIGGDTMAENRLLLPALPFALVALQEGLARILTIIQGRIPQRHQVRPRQSSLQPVPFVVLAMVALGLTLTRPHEALVHARRATAAHNDKLHDLVTYMRGLSNMPALVASTAIGIPRYFTNAAILDLVGLTDTTIARHPQHLRGIRDDHILRNYETTYAMSRAPALIYFIAGTRPATPAERALFLSSRFRNDYVLRYLRDDRPISARRPSPPRAADRDLFEVEDLFENGRFVELYSDGLAVFNSNPTAAHTMLEACAAIAPDDFEDVYYWLGRLAYEGGDDETARSYLQHVLRIDDEHIMAHAHLAVVELRSGKLADAMSHARRARQLAPQSHFAAYVLGRVMLEAHQDDEAIRSLRDAAQLPGRDTINAMLDLGLLYQRRGDDDAAQRTWEAIVRIAPANAQALRYLRSLPR